MRVLFLCEKTDGMDGWATYARYLVNGMRAKGHDVHVGAVNADGQELCLPRPLRLLSRPWIALALARRIAAYCENVHPDIIHVTTEPYALAAPFLPRNLRRKMVLTTHGSYGVRPLQYFRTRWLAARMYGIIPAFIAVSEYTKHAVSSELHRYGYRKTAARFLERTVVMHNAVPLPEHTPERSPRRTEEHVVLSVGGVKARKGILEAIDGCAAYRRLYGHPLRFVVVGTAPDDEYVRSVRARIATLGMEDAVTLTGAVSHAELERHYEAADLFLLPAKTTPTTFEGFGIAFLEANARGIPCIGPRTSGAAEAIAEGKSGFHADPSSPEEIADRMHRILDLHAIDPAACIAWAAAHSLGKQLEAVEGIYRSLHAS